MSRPLDSSRRTQIVSQDEFGDNYEAIFGDDKTRKARIAEQAPSARAIRRTGNRQIIGSMEPIKSPVTGKEISCRGTLRAHNKEHGVTDARDYSPAYMDKATKEKDDRITGNTAEDRNHRRQAIADAQHGRG